LELPIITKKKIINQKLCLNIKPSEIIDLINEYPLLTKIKEIEAANFEILDSMGRFNELIETSPYIVKSRKLGTMHFDKDPLATIISGFDCYSLILIKRTFCTVKLYSASFTQNHYLIWQNLNINFEKRNLDLQEQRDDYGSIILVENKIKISQWETLSECFEFLHFCQNKKKK